METIKQILMRRDGMSAEDAQELIDEARYAMYDALERGDQDEAENVCQDWFGLEPDYLMELL